MLNRAEHLKWAKDRALAYLAPVEVTSTTTTAKGERTYGFADGRIGRENPPPVSKWQLRDACASFLSDLRKHPEIDPSAASMVYAIEVMSGGLNTEQKVRDFINGTN